MAGLFVKASAQLTAALVADNLTRMKEQPKETGGSAESRQRLVFKPDERHVARVARFRRMVLFVTVLLLSGTILWFVVYRPAMPEQDVPVGRADQGPPSTRPEVSVPGVVRDSGFVNRAAVPTGPDVVVRATIVRVDRQAAVALGCWQAIRVLNLDVPAGDGAAGAGPGQFRTAALLLDSADVAVADVRDAARQVVGVMRDVDADRRYRLSILRVALDKYGELLDKERLDQRSQFVSRVAADRARSTGDAAETEIKLNVATSYQRRSENRRKQFTRRSVAVRAAAKRFLGD